MNKYILFQTTSYNIQKSSVKFYLESALSSLKSKISIICYCDVFKADSII